MFISPQKKLELPLNSYFQLTGKPGEVGLKFPFYEEITIVGEHGKYERMKSTKERESFIYLFYSNN